MPAFFDDWDALWRPKRIALVGASEQSQFANMIVANYRQLQYSGELVFVNPRRETAFGQPCYPRLSALPQPVECVVTGIPAEHIPALVKEAVGCGVRAFVIYAGGFGEAGAEGKARQDEIQRLCREARAALLGPNCLGLFNAKNGLGLYGDPPPNGFKQGPVGVVAQSGSVGNLLMHLGREIGFTYVATTGNEVVLRAEDLLEYYLADADTRIILAFLEGLREPRRFMQLARRALAMGKPIIALKIGQSEMGARMARGHTSALAGSARVFEAVCRDTGVIQVHDFDEMAAVAELVVHSGKLPAGPRTAVIGISGGETGLIADVADAMHLPLPPLTEETAAAVREVMGVPRDVAVLNPFDLGLGRGSLPDRNNRAMLAIGHDPDIDIVAINQDIYPDIDEKLMLYRRGVVDNIVRCAAEIEKPFVLLSPFAAGLHPELVAKLHGAAVAALQGARAGLLALRRVGQYAERRAQGEPAPYQADPARVQRALAELSPGQQLLGERATQRLLSEYGIPTPRATLAHSADEAAQAASAIGFPVVLKIESPDIVHKSDVGGVRLGLQDAGQVTQAYDAIISTVRAHQPEARIEGVLVAEQVQGAVELIVGIQQDIQFGPVVLVGMGGVLAEVLNQVALAIPPLSADSARELLCSFAGHEVLASVRGQPPADLDAVAGVLVRVGQLALDGDGLFSEMDINPLIVGAAGQRCCAVDARVLLGE